jgi:branched-chain amino acid transport system substrate-binding protein
MNRKTNRKVPMKKLTKIVTGLAVAAIAATALTGCSSSNKLIISTDLPLQGSAFDSNDSTNKAIELYLEQQGYKAGTYEIAFKTYDNATAAKGSWDDAKCAANAQDHVANKKEVAIMGTYNSGCAKIIAPVVNQAPDGPMLMISNANTNPGLTKKWNEGEPEKYFPTGNRSYARVCTTDDNQGSAAAQFAAQDLKVKSVYVLNDTETYGQGVAQAFTTEAKKQGIKVLSSGAYGEGWDKKQTDYSALFTKIKALKPDMVYFGGIFDNNGGQLTKDKVKVLGDNTKVKLMGPDGFTGYPEFNELPEAQGAYLTFAGLSTDLLIANNPNGAGAKFVADYKAKYGKDPVGSYPIYGVAAVQFILKAIAASDGTRKGVRDAVFTGAGISLTADESVLGKSATIDPATGDINAIDITIEVVKDNKETTLKAWTVQK